MSMSNLSPTINGMAVPSVNTYWQRHAAITLHMIEKSVGAAAGGVLALLLAVVLAAVTARYLGTNSLAGADELALWLYVTLVFLGLPLAASGALAMRLDLLSARLQGKWQWWAETLVEAIVIQAACVFLFGAVDVWSMLGGTSDTLGIPENWRYGPVILGAALTLVTSALRAASLPLIEASKLVSGWILGTITYVLLHHLGPWPVGLPSAIGATMTAFGIVIGAPLPHALIAGLLWTLPVGGLLPEPAVVQNAVSGVGRFLLLAIPFFLLAGVLMASGGLAERLIRLASSLVGHRRGGLAQTTLLTNVMFSGVSGSSIADAAFGGKVLAPALIARGYAPEKAAAIVAATSVLPNIIPPSIAFLILAAATNLSVGELFQGGLVAGLILAATLALALHLLSHELKQEAAATPQERKAAWWGALPVLGMAFIIVLGIRMGVVTPTEAAAVAAAYALVVAMITQPSLRWRGLGQVFVRAGCEASAVGLLIGCSTPLVFLLAVDRVPDVVTAVITGIGGGPFGVMLATNLILLVAGCVLDIGAAILLLAPLMLPVAVAAGIDPIHFGVILVVNLMIGGLTPPVGMLVYVTSNVMRLPAATVFRASLPLLGALLVVLALLAMAAAVWALR